MRETSAATSQRNEERTKKERGATAKGGWERTLHQKNGGEGTAKDEERANAKKERERETEERGANATQQRANARQ